MNWAGTPIEWLVGAARNLGEWLRPFVDPGLWVISTFCLCLGILLIVARLVGLTVGPKTRWTASERWWFWYTSAGLGLILTASILWTIAGTTGLRPSHGLLVGLAAVLASGGVAVFGRGLGQRLRIRVTVVDKAGSPSSVGSSYVAARMEAMGTSRPAGLLFPHGSDAANLPEGALSTMDTDQSKFVAALLAVLRGLASVTPWRAEIALVDVDTATVSVTRNGRRVDSELISKSAFLAGPPDANKANESMLGERVLLASAAAFLLFRLSRSYPRLEAGLAGTSRWKSLAFQILAATSPWSQDPDISKELFARAVDEDPGNRSAWLGYLVQHSGSFGSSKTITPLADRLERLWKSIQDIPRSRENEIALRIRLLRTITLCYTNSLMILPPDSNRSDALQRAGFFAGELMREVDRARAVSTTQPMLTAYIDRMRPLAGSLYMHVLMLQKPDDSSLSKVSHQPVADELYELAKKWVPDDYVLASLRFQYDRACDLLEEDPRNADAALPHLELALGLKELRGSAVSDPSLRALRENLRFASLIDSTAKIRNLRALRMHADKLAADGIRLASEFLARDGENDDAHLASSLSVPVETVQWMRKICELEQCCPEPRLAVEWTNMLTEEGIDSLEMLQVFLSGKPDEVDEVAERMNHQAGLSSVAAPSITDLYTWAYGTMSNRNLRMAGRIKQS